jgi:hypothetical protein
VSLLREQLCQQIGKARHHIAAIQRIAGLQRLHRVFLAGEPEVDLALFGSGDPHQPHTTRQPLPGFGTHL